ncbi:small RNA 2'-O-methyltransferase isoform X1 [Conger conger]|uniref:small RNA 2'-O-methyltransferase isoform X1 n=2 Tax=Conger conger TaxID=82655 RepID=UPI002A59EE22|nr:small RNA 2'-O-methyltransferase isoform X1 [Conger conger]
MNPLFIPPLYKQRYQFVVDFVKRHKPKKVVDLGCADCSLLRKLKFHRNIELLVGVDLDNSVMKQKMYTLAPFPCEYLKPADQPLTIELYHGSVTEKESRTKCFDLVTCIELIEHLLLADVERFSEVLFGYMLPNAVIVSTPNADFNPLLPGCPAFRHIDHKFEWTKADFQNWALEVCRLYGYVVEFTGVGKAPSNEESIGFCSQIGVFHKDPYRSGTFVRSESMENTSSHTLLYHVVYPSLCDNNIFQRTLVNEVLYEAERIKSKWLGVSGEEQAGLRVSDADFPNGCQEQGISQELYLQGGAVCVPLARVLSFPSVRRLCGSLQELQDSLQGDSRVVLTGDALALVLAAEEEEEAASDEECDEYEGPACSETVKCAADCTEDWDAELSCPCEISRGDQNGAF